MKWCVSFVIIGKFVNTVLYKSSPTGLVGQHILGELKVRDSQLLNDPRRLTGLVKKAIRHGGLHLVRLVSHQFDPVGVTVIAIVSESHVAIHTYPEWNHVSVDIYTCAGNPSSSMRTWEVLNKAFQPYTARLLHILRGEELTVKARRLLFFPNRLFTGSDDGVRSVFRGQSKFQTINITQHPRFGRTLFLNGDLQVTAKDAHLYNCALVDPHRKNRPGTVLILGGGDGGILYEILKLNPEKVTVVDMDAMVIAAAKKYLFSICHRAFSDRRVKVIIEDAIKYLSHRRQFDAVIYDLTAFPEMLVGLKREKFLIKILRGAQRALVPGGIMTFQCGSATHNNDLRLVQRYLRKFFPRVSFSRVYIPSYGEHWVFARAEQS